MTDKTDKSLKSVWSRKRDVLWTPARENLRAVATGQSRVFWMTEPDGYCIFLNRAWTTRTGQPEGEGLGFGWLFAVHPSDRAPLFEQYINSTAALAPVQLEYRVMREAEHSFEWVISIGIPYFDEQGKLEGYAGSVIGLDQLARARAREGMLLTPREREAVLWASQGLTSAETADRMGVVARTVEAFLISAGNRLQTANKAHTVAEAMRLGEIPM